MTNNMTNEEKIDHLFGVVLKEINKHTTKESFLESKFGFSSQSNEIYKSLSGLDRAIFDAIVKKHMEHVWNL